MAKGPRVVLIDESTAVFHPVWSNSTEAVKGTRVLNDGKYYWEIAFGARVFGTAMMVGIGTAEARVRSGTFEPIIGEDGESWGLCHKGYIHHNGEKQRYCTAFTENMPTVIGVLFNGHEGTVTFYKDGISLGVAFSEVNLCKKWIYPMVSSTAAKTVMRVQNMRRGFEGLQDLCRDVILRNLTEPSDVLSLPLPYHMKKFVFQQSWKTRIGRDLCLSPYK